MKEQVIRNALEFLKRVSLKWEEAIAFMEVINYLNSELQPKVEKQETESK